MTNTEAARRTALENALLTLGFTRDESDALRRISMTLRRWRELECGVNGGCIERHEVTGRPHWISAITGWGYTVPDRERGALRRLEAIMSKRPELGHYIQTDPRGAALYILRPGDVPANERAESYYTRGLCVY
jgi:hypothetical protein